MEAGFPASDIEVIDGVVYVGGDAAVSLQASREMLQTDKGSREQYRMTNLIGRDHLELVKQDFDLGGSGRHGPQRGSGTGAPPA